MQRSLHCAAQRRTGLSQIAGEHGAWKPDTDEAVLNDQTAPGRVKGLRKIGGWARPFESGAARDQAGQRLYQTRSRLRRFKRRLYRFSGNARDG